MPPCGLFKPAGVPASSLEQVTLSVDELEAMRLADLEGLYQEQAAPWMNVSRQTFARIVESGRRKVAQALVQGKALRIEGGVIEMVRTRKFVCTECKKEWEVPHEVARPRQCPRCDGVSVHRHPDDRGGWGRRGRRGRGRCLRGARADAGPQPLSSTEP